MPRAGLNPQRGRATQLNARSVPPSQKSSRSPSQQPTAGTAPQAPAMPAAQAQQPSGPAPAPAPAPRNDAAAERIRREMDELRSRIDGYGSDRRRA